MKVLCLSENGEVGVDPDSSVDVTHERDSRST